MKCPFPTPSPLANSLLFRFWTTAPPSWFFHFPDCLWLPSMPLCFQLSQLFFVSFSKLVVCKVWFMKLQHQNHLGPDQTKWIRTAEGKLGMVGVVCWLVKCSWGFSCTPEFKTCCSNSWCPPDSVPDSAFPLWPVLMKGSYTGRLHPPGRPQGLLSRCDLLSHLKPSVSSYS